MLYEKCYVLKRKTNELKKKKHLANRFINILN